MSGEYPANAEYRFFAISHIGRSHAKTKKVCQDNSGAAQSSDRKMKFIAVSDGHGGNNYFRSHEGSRFAVEAAQACMEEFYARVTPEMLEQMESPSQQSVYFGDMAKTLVSKWYDRVQKDLEGFPFSEKELSPLSEHSAQQYHAGERAERAYGATLVAAVVTPKYWFAIQLGDGSCAAVFEDGTVEFPIGDDPFVQREGTVTSSLCDREAHLRFRHYFSQNGRFPVGLFVATDGVENCFPLSTMKTWLEKIYRSITQVFLESDFNAAKADLLDYMKRELSKSGDDISIAGMVNVHGKLDSLPESSPQPPAEPEASKLEEKSPPPLEDSVSEEQDEEQDK
ncbi:MAG: protein phosphatase 2C domain-containing protein [Planctomycetia bacterium]|nr:protein phosphatase 2C domain-containing protein [Planctomycetia bacterium]